MVNFITAKNVGMKKKLKWFFVANQQDTRKILILLHIESKEKKTKKSLRGKGEKLMMEEIRCMDCKEIVEDVGEETWVNGKVYFKCTECLTLRIKESRALMYFPDKFVKYMMAKQELKEKGEK